MMLQPMNTFLIRALLAFALLASLINFAKAQDPSFSQFFSSPLTLNPALTGNFNEYFSKIRSDGFGKEAKRRIILGTFARMSGFRNAYYLKAMKVRTLLINEYKKAFKNYDVLVSPTMPIVAPLFTEIEKLTPLQNYMLDILTVGPNLTGLPHLTTTAGYFSDLPAGIMFIANHLEEEKLFSTGKKSRIKKEKI